MTAFLPVFDRAATDASAPRLLGFVFAKWNVGEILENSTAKFPVSGINYYLDDLKGDSPVRVYVHASCSEAGDNSRNVDVAWFRDFQLADHLWRLSSAPAPYFIRTHPIILAWLILIFGSLFTFGLAFYVRRVAVQKNEIEQQVVLRTAEIRNSQKRLEQAQRIAQLGGWEWEIGSGALRWSDEAFHVFGYQSQVFEPSFERFMEMVHPDDRERLNHAIEAALQGGGI